MRALRPMGYYANYLELRSCILVLDVGKLAYLFVPPKGLYNRAGPCLAFYGCLWIGLRIVVGPLTPWYDLTTHWTDEAGRLFIAAGLLASMNAVRRLEAHYLRVPGVTLHKGTYPYPTSYTEDETGQQINFECEARVPEKPVFTAKADSEVIGPSHCEICKTIFGRGS